MAEKKKDQEPLEQATPDSEAVLQQLLAAYNAGSYTPKTQEQIQQQAENEYASYYDILRNSAKRQQEQNDLALQQQAEGLQATYDKQRDASRKSYSQAYSQADRHALSRGMQRSSYNAQVLANLSEQGAKALGEIDDAQAQAEGNIEAQRTQLARQLAEQYAQYDAAQAKDVLARTQALGDQEYERGQAADQNRNSLGNTLYNIMYQREQNKGSGSGGSGNGGSTAQVAGQTGYDELNNALNQSTAGNGLHELRVNYVPYGNKTPQTDTYTRNKLMPVTSSQLATIAGQLRGGSQLTPTQTPNTSVAKKATSSEAEKRFQEFKKKKDAIK